jgi:sortase A
MRAKAAVASVLIARSLESTLRDGRPHSPWGWADFHPVARLRVPRFNLSQPVLSGATGATLAFGLGHVNGTAPPGSTGNVAIAGHRDTWAGFLGDVKVGDAIVLESSKGTRTYQVAAIQIVPAEAVEVLAPMAADRLTLVTCWPFGGVARSRQRVVIQCSTARA